MTSFETLPPSSKAPNPKEFIIAREIYEYACFMSVEVGEVEQFERNYQTLRFFYNEMKGVIPDSTKKNTILGLWLLYLLSQNKISEFHSEIESIPIEELSDPYITVPV